MPTDPAELLNLWDTCENLWAVYEVPHNLRAKLLLPLLSQVQVCEFNVAVHGCDDEPEG